MIHPVFSVLISRPELLVDHVAGYAALAREEASSVGLEVAKRAIAWAVVLVSALTFLILAGVAVMLGTALDQFSWALVIVPVLPLVAAGFAWNVARQRMPDQAFNELKAQLEADAQTLRAIGAK
jgi:hypothetical protein